MFVASPLRKTVPDGETTHLFSSPKNILSFSVGVEYFYLTFFTSSHHFCCSQKFKIPPISHQNHHMSPSSPAATLCLLPHRRLLHGLFRGRLGRCRQRRRCRLRRLGRCGSSRGLDLGHGTAKRISSTREVLDRCLAKIFMKCISKNLLYKCN